jgi:hypothetical protein
VSLDPQQYPSLLERVPGYANICAEQYHQLVHQLKMLNAGGAMPEGVECVQTQKGIIAVCRVSYLTPAAKIWLRQMCLDAGWHDVEFTERRNGYEQLEHQVALSYIDKNPGTA